MAAAASVFAEMDCPPYCESSKENNSTGNDTNKELATKNKTCDPSSDFLAVNDICFKNTMDLCLTSLQSLNCTKGTKHTSFIDLQNFSVSHLPPCYQHKEMFNLVTALADLVVMVQVPEKENYLQGTGKIDGVFINTNENRNCYCLKCSTSQNPSKEWGMIRILTSANLLKSCKDATKYKCTLFFDEGEDTVVNLLGNSIVERNLDSDYCQFFCISCDMGLVKKLDAYLDVSIENWSDAVAKYYPTVKCKDERWIVIISHPHGCKKHISLGKWSKLKPRVEYEAAMCPGCSGSYLLLPTFDLDSDDDDDDVISL